MRVLLDECVPRKLKRDLANHEVLSVTERGWSGVENGELLKLAEAEFDVFLTVDQNLKYQQNLASFNIALILLIARNNGRKALLPLMPEVRRELESIKPGDLVRIGARQP
jgi:predicted nuclease of predicted toxin-antitoxin system